MDWHTEVEEEEKLSEAPEAEAETAEEPPIKGKQEEASEVESPVESNYKTWDEIPEKERKHYGI